MQVTYTSSEDEVDSDFDIDEGEDVKQATQKQERELMKRGKNTSKKNVYLDPGTYTYTIRSSIKYTILSMLYHAIYCTI